MDLPSLPDASASSTICGRAESSLPPPGNGALYCLQPRNAVNGERSMAVGLHLAAGLRAGGAAFGRVGDSASGKLALWDIADLSHGMGCVP